MKGWIARAITAIGLKSNIRAWWLFYTSNCEAVAFRLVLCERQTEVTRKSFSKEVALMPPFEHEILLVRHRMQEQLLTIRQVAEYLSVDKFTIYRFVAAGQLQAFKVGNQWRFKKSLIERWLKTHSNLHTKAPQRNKYRRRI